ncbi:alpha/beta fold hydrolase [Amycolatopsis sp. NBC_01480]|uniref:alpha/beta fold hydrolase n=1 Tax=Amycolatopsis sp. NBC_01480 TaxID=2903562 RepID=UPI002E2C0427|nr:alpha/beta hydrolase [Amycolatopsis sp. NBC_01480]
MSAITLNGDEIHYADVPGPTHDAPVLVWAHGFLLSAKFYLDIISTLPAYRHVIVDHRGHGRSAAIETDATLRRMADDIWGVVSSLGINRFGYVGHSMGSAVGWRLAAEHPAAIAAGVAIAGIPVTGKRPESREWVLSMIDMAGKEDVLAEMIGGLYKHLAPGSDHVRSAGAEAALVPRECIREIVTGQFHVDQRAEALPALTQPWLFVVSSDDESEPPEHQLTCSALLPDSTSVILEGEGHMVCQERPEQVARHIADFLGRLQLR